MLIISERKPHTKLIFLVCLLFLLGFGGALLTMVIDDGPPERT